MRPYVINMTAKEIMNRRFYDVVFDIDWTIADVPQGVPTRSDRSLRIHNQDYRIVDHTEDLLSYLEAQSDVRVSFFSGGAEDRNIELLKSIRLRSGRSAHDLAYRTLSNQHLTPVAVGLLPANAKFSERFKKDLSLINTDLNQIILIDDIHNFSLQPDRTLYVGDTFLPFESFGVSVRMPLPEKIVRWRPQNFNQWYLSKNRMIAVLEILDESLAQARRTGQSFSELVKEKEKIDRLMFITRGLNRLDRESCSEITETEISTLEAA